MPPNLFLLCGDGNLEPMAPAINGAAAAPALTPASNPWLWIHRIIRALIENVASGAQHWMTFVDTNPSFSVYTELAVSAVNFGFIREVRTPLVLKAIQRVGIGFREGRKAAG